MNEAIPTLSADQPGTTPLMAQYLALKERHPDALLFYRMGDFYELFFADAAKAAAALDIVLTRRGKHLGQDIEMCGVPVHSAEGYLHRLIRQGFKVAICEQVEDPAEARKRGSKAVVKREIVRVVTAGTLTEDGLLDARQHNYLAALGDSGTGLGLAWVDISTGRFCTQAIGEGRLGATLARLDPTELLVPERLSQRADLFETLRDWRDRLSILANARFESESARQNLERYHAIQALDALGAFTRAEISAAGAILSYVELTQQGKLPRLARLSRLGDGAVMEIDAPTRRNLELMRSLNGERQGSLLGVIDRTVTGSGARLLADWLSAPLTDVHEIRARQDCLAHFRDNQRQREEARAVLRQAPEMERALSRLALDRGGPRDLKALAQGMKAAAEMKRALAGPSLAPLPDALAKAIAALDQRQDWSAKLARALADDVPMNARDGGFIAQGYVPELDEARELQGDSRRLIASLETSYRALTGVASLKIRHNNVLGYHIDATSVQAERVRQDERFIHRQTTANSSRFTTTELGELEQKINLAGERAIAIELRLFREFAEQALGFSDDILAIARALGLIDVAAALGDLAEEWNWSRPELTEGLEFEIEGGRHPVVEAAIAKAHGPSFVANDCNLSPEQRLWLVTGPNMAGKSTFLRQNALIAILSQMGSFVPARKARIGIVDRLFSRVGAADDLARGRSTFMVEMVETAAILNQAGARSLIILDEIGRGTATFDGLSIAWACLEHLHEINKSRALFATHYHELNNLSGRLAALSPHTLRVKEWQGEVRFLHEVAPGAADRSYGIHVAELAGLPEPVIRRANEVLGALESGKEADALIHLAEDLPLFQASVLHAPEAGKESPLDAAFKNVHPDELTPREALDLIFRLKELAAKK